jgi:hypothetical protein
MILAVYGGGSADQVAIPLWLLALAALGYWWIGRRSARWWYGLETLLALALGAGASLVAITLAFLAGSSLDLLPFAWFTALENDLLANGATASRAALIIGIFAYLGWRAVTLGRRLPDVSGAKRRFTFSFAALALASVTLVGLPADSRNLVVGLLALLLPVDVFSGLLASALARRQEAQAARAESAQIDGVRWMGTALILSGVVVLITLALSVLINLDAVSAVLGHLGPIGQVLENALTGVILLLERVLSALFDAPLAWLEHFIRSAGTTTTRQPPQPVAPGRTPQSGDLARWRFLAIALLSTLVSLALIFLAFGFMRLLRRDADMTPDETIDEERSALDGGALLREQMRDLFGRFQRGSRALPDALPPNSVRSLYRDLLMAASTRGIGRRKAETPDEFASRLAGALSAENDDADVATLTNAYDTARYGEREPERVQMEALRAAAQRLTSTIAGP